MAAAIPDDHDLLLAARRVPLVQSSVAEFGSRHSARQLSSALACALPTAGAHAAAVLAVAAAHGGELLDPEVVRSLLPELDSISLVGPLVFASRGDRVALLVQFLDDGAGAWEREALALLLAADLLAGAPPPKRIITHARRLARKSLGGSASLVFGAAAARLHDPHLEALAAHHVALGRNNPRLGASVLAAARLPPIQALPTAPPPRISSGYTIRNETRSPGRNDPCPCGSGKKFKKCCAAAIPATADEPPPIDPALLSAEQVADFRPSAIAELDPARLSRRARIEGFRRLVLHRRWHAAERFLDAIRAGVDLAEGEEWRYELIDGAIHARAKDVVERHLARVPAEHRDRRLTILSECLHEPPDLIARLHEHARVALETEDVETTMNLAFAMIDFFPALGIFIARGALMKHRELDSFTLLESMEGARDELGIAPFEPWWDVWEQIVDRPNHRTTADERETVERITGELRRAREKADEASTEAGRLQRRLDALEAAAKALAPAAPAARVLVTAAAPADDTEQEKRRLRSKVEELKRIVSQGQEERRELRRRLATAAELTSGPAESETVLDDSDSDSNSDSDSDAHESIERPRRILVPAFAPRASKALVDLSPEVAEAILVLVAELAAGRENAWSSVKQLRTSKVLSARAGIHYRLLFGVGEGGLNVLHVIHRRELEQAVASLG